MSQATVEIVESGLDAFNRLDTEILIRLVTLDCEWFPAMPGAALSWYIEATQVGHLSVLALLLQREPPTGPSPSGSPIV
jgi:hypothetical protein